MWNVISFPLDRCNRIILGGSNATICIIIGSYFGASEAISGPSAAGDRSFDITNRSQLRRNLSEGGERSCEERLRI